MIRPCRDDERAAILEIVNAAADAYRGAIPADRWHEPYMDVRELDAEIAAGVAFWGYEDADALVGVMGIQRVRDVDLIRHAYVRPASQRGGVGSALLERLRGESSRRMLVGTWAAAGWAIRFYRRHGFEQVPPERAAALLREYWTIPEEQVETSVVLASPPLPGSLDGRRFRVAETTAGGEVGDGTVFEYHEDGGLVWARYEGGAVRLGFLVGTRDGDRLEFRYSQLNAGGETSNGRCSSTISVLPDGRLRLDEAWEWESRAGSGTSAVEEAR